MHRTRFLTALIVAGALLAGSGGFAGAAPAGFSRADSQSAITFVQDKQKPETVKHAAKRIWRNMTGYKFEVVCLLSRTTCTETGKNREDARAKCQAQHNFCEIRDAR